MEVLVGSNHLVVVEVLVDSNHLEEDPGCSHHNFVGVGSLAVVEVHSLWIGRLGSCIEHFDCFQDSCCPSSGEVR